MPTTSANTGRANLGSCPSWHLSTSNGLRQRILPSRTTRLTLSSSRPSGQPAQPGGRWHRRLRRRQAMPLSTASNATDAGSAPSGPRNHRCANPRRPGPLIGGGRNGRCQLAPSTPVGRFTHRANLPTVVVFPKPLTPTKIPQQHRRDGRRAVARGSVPGPLWLQFATRRHAIPPGRVGPWRQRCRWPWLAQLRHHQTR